MKAMRWEVLDKAIEMGDRRMRIIRWLEDGTVLLGGLPRETKAVGETQGDGSVDLKNVCP